MNDLKDKLKNKCRKLEYFDKSISSVYLMNPYGINKVQVNLAQLSKKHFLLFTDQDYEYLFRNVRIELKKEITQYRSVINDLSSVSFNNENTNIENLYFNRFNISFDDENHRFDRKILDCEIIVKQIKSVTNMENNKIELQESRSMILWSIVFLIIIAAILFLPIYYLLDSEMLRFILIAIVFFLLPSLFNFSLYLVITAFKRPSTEFIKLVDLNLRYLGKLSLPIFNNLLTKAISNYKDAKK